MEFKEALGLLKKKFKEGHREIGVKVRLRSDGTEELICEIYIRGAGVFTGTTFTECFNRMSGMAPDLDTLPGDDFLVKKGKQGKQEVDPRQFVIDWSGDIPF